MYYWKEKSLQKEESKPGETQVLTFSENDTEAHLPDLHPYSQYSINVRAFNNKGDGPPSAEQKFETPEGGTVCYGFQTVSEMITFYLDLNFNWHSTK